MYLHMDRNDKDPQLYGGRCEIVLDVNDHDLTKSERHQTKMSLLVVGCCGPQLVTIQCLQLARAAMVFAIPRRLMTPLLDNLTFL